MSVVRHRGDLRDEVRDEVSCLDSIGDVMRQALDVLQSRWRTIPQNEPGAADSRHPIPERQFHCFETTDCQEMSAFAAITLTLSGL